MMPIYREKPMAVRVEERFGANMIANLVLSSPVSPVASPNRPKETLVLQSEKIRVAQKGSRQDVRLNIKEFFDRNVDRDAEGYRVAFDRLLSQSRT